MISILIVDDEPVQSTLLKEILDLEGYHVYTASNISSALDSLSKIKTDIILSDYKMDNETGEDLLDRVMVLYPDSDFILITAFGTIDTAVRCMKKGAFGFINKPVNLEELRALICKAVENKNLKDENKKLKEILRSSSDTVSIIGSSDKIGEIKTIISRITNLDVPVLIEGETGTGKELAARAIHFNGVRGDEPFVAVNMAGIPETLIESELFGYERGSFTGALKDKKGKFELAGKGTLFLDEIGEMNIDLQSKLLRVLQEGEIERIGSEKSIKIHCRIVAATNRNLASEIKNGKFREDLYYRLNLIKIKLPPLRERKEDIPLLIRFFIFKYSRKYNIDELSMEKYFNSISSLYASYDFPGNIRELENIVERFLIFPDFSCFEHLSPNSKPHFRYAGKSLSQIEKEAIIDTLEYCGGNRNRAAEMLGISERGIRYKLKEYNIE